jgi:phosphonate transport system permease protein
MSGTRVWQRRERGRQLAVWAGWLLGTAIFVYCWQLISEKTIWMFVLDAPEQAADLAQRMVPPRWSYMNKLWIPIWDTLNIATLGRRATSSFARLPCSSSSRRVPSTRSSGL